MNKYISVAIMGIVMDREEGDMKPPGNGGAWRIYGAHIQKIYQEEIKVGGAFDLFIDYLFIYFICLYRYSDVLSGEKLHGETFERNKLCVLFDGRSCNERDEK